MLDMHDKPVTEGARCRFFAETRRTGAFELLLAAPLKLNRSSRPSNTSTAL